MQKHRLLRRGDTAGEAFAHRHARFLASVGIEADRAAQHQVAVFAQEDGGRVDRFGGVEQDVQQPLQQFFQTARLERGGRDGIERPERAIARLDGLFGDESAKSGPIARRHCGVLSKERPPGAFTL